MTWWTRTQGVRRRGVAAPGTSMAGQEVDEIVVNMDGPKDPPDLIAVTLWVATRELCGAKAGDFIVARVQRVERRVVEE